MKNNLFHQLSLIISKEAFVWKLVTSCAINQELLDLETLKKTSKEAEFCIWLIIKIAKIFSFSTYCIESANSRLLKSTINLTDLK